MRKYFVIALLPLALAACNEDQGQNLKGVASPSGLNGTYTSVDGKNTLVFSYDSKVKTKSLRGVEMVTNYTSEGGKVNFRFSQGYPISLTVNSDGSLTSDSNTKYKKSE